MDLEFDIADVGLDGMVPSIDMDQLFGFPESDGWHDAGDDGPGLRSYLRQISALPLLTGAEEAVLGRLMKNGDPGERKKALSQLVSRNLRLVVFLAKKLCGRGLDMTDLIQEGNLGLIRAAELYDVDKGCRFTTYASNWIVQFMKRAITNNGMLIRIPCHIHDELRLLRKAYSMTGDGSYAELVKQAGRFGLSEDRVLFLLSVPAQPVSLDKPVSMEDPDSPPLEENVSVGGASTEETALSDVINEALWAAVDGLDEKSAYVVRERMGYGGHGVRTLEDIGAELGISRERVRQIEKKAMKQLYYRIKKAGIDRECLV